MDRTTVHTWLETYELLWRDPGTDRLGELFTDDATYLPSPWATPLTGLDALRRFWEDERDGPDEEFTMTAEVVAVDGGTAVVRVEVQYAAPGHDRWRDLWVMELDDDGRCRRFEEWPFAPDQPDGHA